MWEWRRRTVLCAAPFLATALMSGGTALAAEQAERVRAWLATLDAGQATAARSEFAARRDWHFTPRQRSGAALRDLSAAQRAPVWDLVDAVLSPEGRDLARGVLRLEGILGELTGRVSYRDPLNYAFAVFGEPGTDQPWAWRFEGHHLSLTFTYVPGLGAAVTPAFLGSNPAVVPANHQHAGDELLSRRRERGFALLESLTGATRERAVIAVDAPRDILTGPGSEQRLIEPEGVGLAALAEGQKDLAWSLVQSFTGHLRDDLRAAAESQIRETGLDAMHFAWAGGSELGSPHYFRLHGPVTVIEYDNVQNGANHAHSVWHEPHDVFGDDRLRRHHLDDHGLDDRSKNG